MFNINAGNSPIISLTVTQSESDIKFNLGAGIDLLSAAVAGGYSDRAAFLAASPAASVIRAGYLSNTGQTVWFTRHATGPITLADGSRWQPDGQVSILHFGDRSVSDNSPALQAAVDWVLSTDRGAGDGIYIPEGSWVFATEVLVDISAISGYPNTENRGCAVYGAGERVTVLKAQTDGMNILRFVSGSPITTANYSYIELVSDLSFAGNTPTSRTATGLVLEDIAFFTLSRVLFVNLNVGLHLDGSLSGHLTSVHARENTTSILGTAGASNVNAITFSGCNIQRATNRAISITGGCSNITFLGGSVEGSGTHGDASTGGIYLEGTGGQGEVSLSCIGTYFEGNKGGFDVKVEETGTEQMLLSLNGSQFQRTSGTSYVNHNVVTTGEVRVVSQACTYTGRNTYVADAGRAYFDIGAGGELVDLGNTFQDGVEAPRTDRTTVFTGKIEGSLGASVTANLPEGWTISYVNTGIYQVIHNLGHTNYTVTGLSRTFQRTVDRTVDAANSFQIVVVNRDFVRSDGDLSFTLTPFGGAT